MAQKWLPLKDDFWSEDSLAVVAISMLRQVLAVVIVSLADQFKLIVLSDHHFQIMFKTQHDIQTITFHKSLVKQQFQGNYFDQ